MFGSKNETSRPKVTSSSPSSSIGHNKIAEGTVVVGSINAAGYIEGNIDSRVATVEGEIKGNVVTRELLTIDKTGKIFGDIFTQKLVVQMGAIFTGTSKMADAAKDMLTKTPQRAKDLLAKSSARQMNPTKSKNEPEKVSKAS